MSISKIKEIKIREEDGSYSDPIPMGADAINIDLQNGSNVETEIQSLKNKDIELNLAINSNQGNINTRLNNLEKSVSSLASGSPKGSYETVSALQSANPDTGVYIIQEDGHAYSWTKNGGTAIDLGVYMSTTDYTDLEKYAKFEVAKGLAKNIYIESDIENKQMKIYSKEPLTILGTYNSYYFGIISGTIQLFDNITYIFINTKTKTFSSSQYGYGMSTNDMLLCIIISTIIPYDIFTFITSPYKTSGYLLFDNQIVGTISNKNLPRDEIIHSSGVIYINTEYIRDEGKIKIYNATINFPYDTLITTAFESYSITPMSKTFEIRSDRRYYACYNPITKEIKCIPITSTTEHFLYDYIIAIFNYRTAYSRTKNDYNIYFNNLPISNYTSLKELQDVKFSKLKINFDQENKKITITNTLEHQSGAFLVTPDNCKWLKVNDAIEIDLQNVDMNTTQALIYNAFRPTTQWRIVTLYNTYPSTQLYEHDIIVAYFICQAGQWWSPAYSNVYINDVDVSLSARLSKKIKNEIIIPESEEHYDFLRCFEKFTAIGDSETAGYVQTSKMSRAWHERTEPSTIEQKWNWFAYMMNRLNKEGNNQAYSGSSTKTWRNTHISNVLGPTDCYVICLGINDLGSANQVDVGTNDDIKTNYEDNPNTFYGNYDWIIRKITEANPYCKIFVFTLPDRYTTEKALQENEAIRYMAQIHNNVYLVDIANELEQKDGTYIGNFWVNGHLEPIGYNYISLQFEKLMNKIISDNYQDFMEVPLSSRSDFPWKT